MFAFAIAWFICAGLCAFIANEKGRGVFSWMLLGFFFGIFAVIGICAVPSLGKKVYEEIEDQELREWKEKMGRK